MKAEQTERAMILSPMPQRSLQTKRTTIHESPLHEEGRRKGNVMPITLITGGNKGLGRESARRLIELGHTVYIGARDAERGQAAADELGAQFLLLNVTDDASVDAAAASLTRKEGHLDVLINNAGIAGLGLTTDGTSADDMRRIYETNVFGIVRMTCAFLPLLRASAAGVIVNVSSGLGSFGLVTNPQRLEWRCKFAN